MATKQTARKSTAGRSARPTTTGTSVHPCFRCGLIFAKKDDYVLHQDHCIDPLGDGAASLPCTECGRMFGNDASLKEHLVQHDVAKLVAALHSNVSTRKRHSNGDTPTAAVTVSPVKYEHVSTISTTSGSVFSANNIEENSALSINLIGKNRPRSKSVAVDTPKKPSPVLEAPRIPILSSMTSFLPSVSAATPVYLPSKKRRLSAVPGMQIPEDVSLEPIRKADVKESPGKNVSAGIIASDFSANEGQETQKAPVPVSNTSQGTLQTVCPNCNQSFSKPWYLVDHMIQQHDAQIARLQRLILQPDGSVINQTFNERVCQYCQMGQADVQKSLVHVVRAHRCRLFECPDNGECVLTCELMSVIDGESKKYTISVKVKRKANGSS